VTTLRWILGLIIALLGGGYVILLVVSNGLRKSFGASETNPLLVVLPLVAVAVLAAALVWPANRTLLHIAAIAAVGLIGFCVWQMISESVTVLWFGIIYLVAWLVFYWQAAWQTVTASTGQV
jgi:hypothetical protein